MLSIQKFASDQIGLGYDFSFPSIASTSIIVFVAPVNNIEIENNFLAEKTKKLEVELFQVRA